MEQIWSWFDSSNGKFTSTIKNAAYDSYREYERGEGTAVIHKKLKVEKVKFSASDYKYFELYVTQ